MEVVSVCCCWLPKQLSAAALQGTCTVAVGTVCHLYSVARWWRGTVVERRSLAGELSLSCARPAADG